MSFVNILRPIFYSIIRFFAKIIFTVFYRDYGAFHSENFPPNDGTPSLFIAAPHGNFLMDAITVFVSCPRNMYFLSAKSNFNYPIFGTIITLLGCIPVTRPQDVERINGDGVVTVIEEGKVVTGQDLGKILTVGDMLYVEFERLENNDLLKEASGIVEQIIDDNTVRIKEPGMKWLTKGRKKGNFRKLVEYGSVFVRVERGNTLKTLEGLNFIPKSVSSSLSKSFDKFSSSPGRLPFQIHDELESIPDIVIHPNDPAATETTPLLSSESSSSSHNNLNVNNNPYHNRQSSSRSLHRSSNYPIVPNIPTTYSYTHTPPHSEVYSSVYNHFSQSHSVAIFPEGTSHDNAHMLSLKYGCAVMSLGYLSSTEPDASGKPRTLRLVPCGLNFFNRHRFRSRVFVDIGKTIEIEQRLIDMYRNGGEDKRLACQELLTKIQKSLSELTVNAPNYDTLVFFKMASRIYREKLEKKLNFPEKLSLLRKITKNYTSKNPPPDETRRLKRDVVLYSHELRKHKLSSSHMNTKPISLLFYLPLFVILFLLTMPGLILYAPIGLVARYVGKKQGENAMLYDDNSLAITRWPGRDVIATWKMMTGTVLFLTFDLIYSILSVHFLREFGLVEVHNRKEVFLLGLVIFFFFWTTVGYGTILLWERMCWVGKIVWVGAWSLFKRKQRFLLDSWREDLSVRICKWVESWDSNNVDSSSNTSPLTVY
ncbi:8302_t:CDS:2 [Entrophospora sp. SA101]|nr:8302_t:CDS:2 [Entrophospora sp. SA101]